jgi:hypothetical protein
MASTASHELTVIARDRIRIVDALFVTSVEARPPRELPSLSLNIFLSQTATQGRCETALADDHGMKGIHVRVVSR